MITKGELGTASRCDDLLAGLNPFTCGHGMGTSMEAIRSRVETYDLVMSGDTKANLAEQLEISTKEVEFPVEATHFLHMLQSTSVCVDVAQGTTHPHAAEF